MQCQGCVIDVICKVCTHTSSDFDKKNSDEWTKLNFDL